MPLVYLYSSTGIGLDVDSNKSDEVRMNWFRLPTRPTVDAMEATASFCVSGFEIEQKLNQAQIKLASGKQKRSRKPREAAKHGWPQAQAPLAPLFRKYAHIASLRRLYSIYSGVAVAMSEELATLKAAIMAVAQHRRYKKRTRSYRTPVVSGREWAGVIFEKYEAPVH